MYIYVRLKLGALIVTKSPRALTFTAKKREQYYNDTTNIAKTLRQHSELHW